MDEPLQLPIPGLEEYDAQVEAVEIDDEWNMGYRSGFRAGAVELGQRLVDSLQEKHNHPIHNAVWDEVDRLIN